MCLFSEKIEKRVINNVKWIILLTNKKDSFLIDFYSFNEIWGDVKDFRDNAACRNHTIFLESFYIYLFFLIILLFELLILFLSFAALFEINWFNFFNISKCFCFRPIALLRRYTLISRQLSLAWNIALFFNQLIAPFVDLSNNIIFCLGSLILCKISRSTILLGFSGCKSNLWRLSLKFLGSCLTDTFFNILLDWDSNYLRWIIIFGCDFSKIDVL